MKVIRAQSRSVQLCQELPRAALTPRPSQRPPRFRASNVSFRQAGTADFRLKKKKEKEKFRIVISHVRPPNQERNHNVKRIFFFLFKK